MGNDQTTVTKGERQLGGGFMRVEEWSFDCTSFVPGRMLVPTLGLQYGAWQNYQASCESF